VGRVLRDPPPRFAGGGWLRMHATSTSVRLFISRGMAEFKNYFWPVRGSIHAGAA
jgi:hypothetical protein